MRTIKAKRKRIKALLDEFRILIRQKIELQSATAKAAPEVMKKASAPPPDPILEPARPGLLNQGKPKTLEGWSRMDILTAYADGVFDGDEEALRWYRSKF